MWKLTIRINSEANSFSIMMFICWMMIMSKEKKANKKIGAGSWSYIEDITEGEKTIYNKKKIMEKKRKNALIFQSQKQPLKDYFYKHIQNNYNE